MSHITYKTKEGQAWRVELGGGAGGLLERFGITEQELPQWHLVMAPAGKLWDVPRMLFAVRPVLGAAIEDMRPREVMDIAARLSAHSDGAVRSADVEKYLERSVEFWKRSVAPCKARVDDFATDEESVTMAQEKAIRVLQRFGFDTDGEPEVRRYLMERVTELEPQLESDDDRVTAMQMLRNEVSLHLSLNPALNLLQSQIRKVVKVGETHEDYKNLKSWQEREKEMISTSKQLQSAIEDAKEALALGESVTGRGKQRDQIQDTVSFLNRSVDEWQRRGDKALIDGVFTVAEVQILTKAYGDRPMQYRIEPALSVQHLMEGLHDPEFSNTSEKGVLLIQKGDARKAMRRMMAGLKGAMERIQMEEEGIENLQDDADEAASAPTNPHGMQAVPAVQEAAGAGAPGSTGSEDFGGDDFAVA